MEPRMAQRAWVCTRTGRMDPEPDVWALSMATEPDNSGAGGGSVWLVTDKKDTWNQATKPHEFLNVTGPCSDISTGHINRGWGLEGGRG